MSLARTRIATLALLAAVVLLLPAVAVGAVAAPRDLCRTEDPRLAELSGLASDGTHRFAVPDGGRRVLVHQLDGGCRIVATRSADIDPFDVEDLARSADGTLWLADVGDNEQRRSTVAVIALPPARAARLYRLSYPDDPHDSEALLLDADGSPVIVTKVLSGRSGIYRADGPLASPGPTPLRRVGTVQIPVSETVGGPLGELGATLVTGAASSVDGRVVALRTYTDAWLYPAPDGDVVAALQRAAVQVPLPGEPQGEALAFDPDGTLLSGSESPVSGVGVLRAVPGAVALVQPVPPGPPGPAPPPLAAPAAVPGSRGGGSAVPAVLAAAAAAAVAGAAGTVLAGRWLRRHRAAASVTAAATPRPPGRGRSPRPRGSARSAGSAAATERARRAAERS